MGISRYKVTYECECGCDYGSCERRSFYLLEQNRSSDTASLFHKHHADEKDSKLEFLLTMTDNSMEALITILTSQDKEPWDDSDIKESYNRA